MSEDSIALVKFSPSRFSTNAFQAIRQTFINVSYFIDALSAGALSEIERILTITVIPYRLIPRLTETKQTFYTHLLSLSFCSCL